jgi:CheY-like chemotaxis protein
LLEGEDALTDGQSGYVEETARSGRRLLGIIDDILDYVRIDAGRLPFAPKSVAPGPAVQEALSLTRAHADEKQITVAVSSSTARSVLADRSRLIQVLRSLLSNAVKFSAPATRIDVTVADSGEGFVRFGIQDQGPGMEGPQLAQLFQAFVQGERALVKRHEGVGLGLALSRKLVELHRGAISVESVPGRGSLFSFTIPATELRPEAAAPEPPPVSAPPPSSRRMLKPVEPRTGPKVLVVDDNDVSHSLVQAMLEPAGYRVPSAYDGDAGVALAKSERPSLILMDLAMPYKDGYAATREIKADAETLSIPVIAFTTLAIHDEQQLQQAGFDGYLGKPFDRQALNEAIVAFIPEAPETTP